MARSRNIKPAIFKNELLGVADPLLTILFAGLWCLADRRGRLEDRPLRIKAEIFPYRELQGFNGYLTDLARLGFIRRYNVDGLDLIDIPAFEKHQHPHHTEKESELPEYQEKSDRCAIPGKYPLKDVVSTDTLRLIPDSLNTDSLLLNTDSPKRAKAAPTKPLDYSCWPEMPKEQTLADWIAMRKRIKADVSQTIINDFSTELHKAFDAGLTVDHCLAKCLSNNWRGFKYQWLLNQETSNAANKQPVKQSRGERHTQAHRDYIASLEQEEANSRLLAGSLGSPVGE